MADTRKVTISITINLGNYENLRLEVSDVAETQEDANNLRHFLADILDGYGNNNATAKNAIDTYKDHILSDSRETAAEETNDPYAYSFSLPEADEETLAPVMPLIPEPESEAEEEKPVEPIAVPHIEPTPETAEFTCSKCGAPVTKLQRDVSMLFNHKILCKNCMK